MAAATSPANSSCTIQGLLQLAKTLAERLSEHENNTENILSEAEELNKDIKSLKTYKDEVDHLNENNRCRPRAQLVKVVQFENNKIKELQKENQELKQALEENQNAMELIMSKYREHVYALSQHAKLDFKSLYSNSQLELEQKNRKILEMVAVMQHVVRLDESSSFASEQKIAQLESENRTLRELLSVCRQFRSSLPEPASNPFCPSTGSSVASPEVASPVGASSSDDMFEGKGDGGDNGNASTNYNPSTVKKRPLPAGEPPNVSTRQLQHSLSEPMVSAAFVNGVKLNNGLEAKTAEPSNNSLTGNSGFENVNGSFNFTLSSSISNTNNNNNYQLMNNEDPKSESYECLRNGPNKMLFGGTTASDSSTISDGVALMNHNGSSNSCNSINTEGGGYGLMYRQCSDNDIVSDTDSDSSSSNASTVTLTDWTSDREEDDEPCPMVPDSLMISTPGVPVPDVVAAVTPFSKSVANCLTNGCITDYHSTAAQSQNSLDADPTTPVITPVAGGIPGSNLTNGIP